MDHRPRTLSTTTVNCCMACCYTSGVSVAATTTKKYCGKITKTTSTNVSCSTSSARIDYDEPPSEAAAFIASASAAAFVLLVALLAVILSSVAALSFASLTPTAVVAADVLGLGSQATDYLHQWHHKELNQQQQLPYQWQQQQELHRGDVKEVERQKRQLFKNKNREPGVMALTFSLIGGTISDVREAYRNVSNIVSDTIREAAKVQQSTTTITAPTAASDQMMMAAGNSVENEIVASSTVAAPVIDQNKAGEAIGMLFGRNYRGLRRLFNSELRIALKNSPGNVRDFTSELIGSIGQSLRPSRLFTRGPVNGNSVTSGKRR